MRKCGFWYPTVISCPWKSNYKVLGLVLMSRVLQWTNDSTKYFLLVKSACCFWRFWYKRVLQITTGKNDKGLKLYDPRYLTTTLVQLSIWLMVMKKFSDTGVTRLRSWLRKVPSRKCLNFWVSATTIFHVRLHLEYLNFMLVYYTSFSSYPV